MSTAVWTLLFVAVGLLLAYSTYAALVGIFGALTHARYERCPECHHHYLADRAAGLSHECHGRRHVPGTRFALHLPRHVG